jgi:hypothetical protein
MAPDSIMVRESATAAVKATPTNGSSSVPTKRARGRAGTADLLFLRPGSPPLFLETKTRTGQQSGTQKAFEVQATTAGAQYVIARSLDSALEAPMAARISGAEAGVAKEGPALKQA